MSVKLRALGTACAVILGGAVALTAYAADDTVEERTKPVGEVCMAGEACAAAASSTTVAAAEARSGNEVYTTKCSVCHASGAAGAPKLDDKGPWESRLAEREIDGLYQSSITGFKGMPAKGLCMDCSEDEIKASVDYMLTESGVEL